MKKYILIIFTLLIFTGCFPNSKTLSYLSTIKVGVENAKKNQGQLNAEILKAQQNKIIQLNNAFDADLKFYFASKPGASKDDILKWTLSARKGYSLAYQAIQSNIINQIKFESEANKNIELTLKLITDAKKQIENDSLVSKKFFEFLESLSKKKTNDQ